MTTSSEVSADEVGEETEKRPSVVAFSNAGKPDILNDLQSLYSETGTVGVEIIQRSFPYPLDSFQIEAVTALVENRSVIVSAPTGSGKTVCGEAAVYLGVALGKKVLYTTPLKALSNQKYSDFCKQFGAERVGLLTGDVSVNRENATIIVLTTEVYRNMLYDKDSGTVSDVHSVILDEFHYMNDRDRGTVWEECVIHSPASILLVALSATMQNVVEIRDWFHFVHGPTTLITSDFRPVPLRFKYVDQKGLLDLFDPKPNKKGLPRLNRRLLPTSFSDEGEKRSYESGRRRRSPRGAGGEDDAAKGKRRRAKGEADQAAVGSSERREGGGKKSRFGGVPSFGFVVRQLAKGDMLPAIVFIFSRVGCDKAAEETAAMRGSLVTAEEKERLRTRLGEFAVIMPYRMPSALLFLRTFQCREGTRHHQMSSSTKWLGSIFSNQLHGAALAASGRNRGAILSERGRAPPLPRRRGTGRWRRWSASGWPCAASPRTTRGSSPSGSPS